MRLTHAAATALGVLTILATAPDALAYPQFQFSTDNTRCSLCHVSPVGGGLINEYGRDEAAETISRGGDGRFLHGLWEPPERLELGADYRGVGAVKNSDGQEPELLGFPMQADIYMNLKLPAKLSVNATVGMRGVARTSEAPPISDRFISREHFLMWRPKSKGKYARIGRFWAPYGLRLQDHTSYIRRYLGFHTFQETLSASYGDVQTPREWHATLFMPAPVWRVGPKAYGGAFMYEKRIHDNTGAWGAQGKVEITGDHQRYIAGGVYKRWFEDKKILLLSELDLALQRFTYHGANADPRGQLALHVSGTYFLTQGVMLGAALERFDEDIFLKKSGRDAAVLNVQYFPRAHFELHLMGKLEFQGEKYSKPSQLALFMLHYYL